MKLALTLVFIALSCFGQVRDIGQRNTPAISAVTPRAFNGAGAPGSVAGNLSQDSYLNTATSPVAEYICGAAAGTPAPACTSVAAGQWQLRGAGASSLYKYDVVANYSASGSAATTTGTIAANTNSLTVVSAATFSVGHGIWIPGCVSTVTQNPHGNLATKVTAISGNIFTLAVNCTIAVTGVTVKHSDCASANAAIAASYNTGAGGIVWFRQTGTDGYYRMNCVADPATGGILTVPQSVGYGFPVPVTLLGEAPNVTLDFSDAPNVSGNSAFSAAPYVAATSGNFGSIFEGLDLVTDNLNWSLPAQTKLNGLMLANALQAHVGNHTVVASAPDVASPCCTWNAPTGGSTGIWMPQAYNNVQLEVGGKVAFMNHCLVPGEHGLMTSPYLYGCNAGIYLYAYNHDVEGSARVESSPIMIAVDSGASSVVPVKFHMDGESWGTSWMAPSSSLIVDAGNKLAGTIDYMLYGPSNSAGSGSNGMQFITRSGALNVTLHNSQSISLYGASGFPLPVCNGQLANDKETVYDAASPTFMGTYVSGGGTFVPVMCNGSNWVTY
jgi:hypothetical protein